MNAKAVGALTLTKNFIKVYNTSFGEPPDELIENKYESLKKTIKLALLTITENYNKTSI
jgi:hypothetical protein